MGRSKSSGIELIVEHFTDLDFDGIQDLKVFLSKFTGLLEDDLEPAKSN